MPKYTLTPLPQFCVDDGDVWHVIRSESQGFVDFGETYISWLNPGRVKGWKKHRRVTSNIVVPVGSLQVLFLDAENSQISTLSLGPSNYYRLTIPPLCWHAFRNLDHKPSMILNTVNEIHDPTECDTIKFDYSILSNIS